MKANITCSIKDNIYKVEFTFEPDTPEYIIADTAYDVAIKFAKAQAKILFDHALSSWEFSNFLEDLNYDYQIES